jgi:phosphoribosylformylglycinamidine synthase
LFSESLSRFIVELAPEDFDAFGRLMLNLPFGQVGYVTDEPRLVVTSTEGNTVLDCDVSALKETWQKTFDWK